MIRFEWQTFPNPNIRELHVEIELWDSNHAECYEIALTDEQLQFVELLEGIRGIVEFGFSKFAIRIKKGNVFGWEEIVPRIESALAEWTGKPLYRVA